MRKYAFLFASMFVGGLLIVPLLSTAAACIFARDLTVGVRGDDVRCLQTYLTSTGHFTYSGGATGYFGPITRAAVAVWQAANGVSPTFGYFGPISRAKYGSIFSATATSTANSWIFNSNNTDYCRFNNNMFPCGTSTSSTSTSMTATSSSARSVTPQVNTYHNSEFGFLTFNYTTDFTVSETRNSPAVAARDSVPLLQVSLERVGHYTLDQYLHEYRDLMLVSVYSGDKTWAETYFTKDKPTTIGGLSGWSSSRSGSEIFEGDFVSKGSYTYRFELHSTKPGWIQDEDPFGKLLGSVSFAAF